MKRIFQACLLSVLAGSVFAAQQTLTNSAGMLTKANANISELYGRGTGIYVKDAPYSALCNGSADDTSAIQAAINAVGSSGGQILLPSATCKITNLIIPKNGTRIRGAGIYATTIVCSPSGDQGAPGNNVIDPGTCFEFGKSGGGNGVDTVVEEFSSAIEDLYITTSDTTRSKAAIRSVETAQFYIHNVLIDGFYGGDSVGVRTFGHENLVMDRVRIEASVPLRISRPVTPISGVTYTDSFHFSNLYLRAPHGSDATTGGSGTGRYPATLPKAVIVVDDAVFMSNVIFDGYENWIGGQYGLYWVNPGNSNSIIYNLAFKNVRWEQSVVGDGTGRYAYKIDFTSAANIPRNILFENGYICTTTGQDSGYYLRKVQAVTMLNEHCPANNSTGTNPVVMNVGDVYQIEWRNVYTDTTARITTGTNVGTLHNGIFRQNYVLPYSGSWPFESSPRATFTAAAGTNNAVTSAAADFPTNVTDLVVDTSAGDATATGMKAPVATLIHGQRIRIGVTGGHNLTLSNEDAAETTAANRFNGAASITIPSGSSMLVQYDYTLSRYLLVTSPPTSTTPVVQVAQWGVPVFLPPSGFFANNGVYVIGQAPASAGTLSVSATSGSVTATFSAATLLGTASDVGRVITILDTTYKYCTITAQSSSTVATCTVSGGSLSGTGPFANNAVWISGAIAGTASYSSLLSYVPANAYAYFPINVISAATAAGVYYMQCVSTTVCTIYNNVLSTGTPAVIGSPTAFSTTGTGAFTQTTGSYLTAVSITLTGGTMGPNGSLTMSARGICVSDANAKLMQFGFGGQGGGLTSVTTTAWAPLARTISNLGSASLQQLYPNSAGAALDTTATSTGYQQLSINTASNVTLAMQLRLATATDWIGLMSGTITANYAP